MKKMFESVIESLTGGDTATEVTKAFAFAADRAEAVALESLPARLPREMADVVGQMALVATTLAFLAGMLKDAVDTLEEMGVNP